MKTRSITSPPGLDTKRFEPLTCQNRAAPEIPAASTSIDRKLAKEVVLRGIGSAESVT
jgi:hypothetical protein